jgi:PadR family transcriptional regulator, regulatory protein PadR
VAWYGIVGEVAELSRGPVRPKIGSLYGVLDRLAVEGLIEPDREGRTTVGYAAITGLARDGRRALLRRPTLVPRRQATQSW